ncbi:MAG: hypothetical protein WCG28_02800 [bacterium]
MKSKLFYNISFWFGVIYLIFSLLSIPSLIVVYQASGVSFAEFTYSMGTNFLIFDFIYFISLVFGSLISHILVSVLILVISLSLIRDKINENKITNIGAIMISIVAIITSIIVVVAIFIFASTHSLQALSDMKSLLSKMTYPIFPIFFLTSFVLLTIGYIKEKLKNYPKKYFGIIFPSLALLIIILLDLLKFFH